MKQWTIEMNIEEALQRLNDMKVEDWYLNLSIKDKVAFQFAIDYLERNSTHYKRLMKIHTLIMEAFCKNTDHLGERMALGKKVKELSENILKSLEEENE